MAKRIFISATNTDIGKTYTATLLLQAFSRLGLRVGVFKPIETGVNVVPLDGKVLYENACSLNPVLCSFSIDDIVPIQYSLPAAPYVASGCKAIDMRRLELALEKIEAVCDIVIIEGAGGLFVPVDETRMMIDFPRHFNAVTLLVTHCKLGCINDTLLNLKALDDAALPYVWALNCREEDHSFQKVSLPYFQHRYKTLYFVQNDIDAIARALLDTITP